MLYGTLTVLRLQKPAGIAVMTELPVSMYIIVQRRQILKLCNLVILITSVHDRLQSLRNSFGQNHLDMNKELAAKVTLWPRFTISRGNQTY